MLRLNKPEEIKPYLRDASQFSGEAEGIFLPENSKETAELLKEANQQKIPVTVSGGRTGLTGAAVPLGGWVLSTEKLNKILEVKKGNRGSGSVARLEPAIFLKDLDKTLEPHGLFYPPDPTGPKAFLGGTLATNASGPNSFKYRTTRDYIHRIKLILADGEILDLKRGQCVARGGILEIPLSSRTLKVPVPHYNWPSIKHAGGYFVKRPMDAIDLFIGSEGTLGVIVEIEILLLPRPKSILAFMAFFKKEEDSWNFVTGVRQSKILNPRILEYFDKGSLEFLRSQFPSIPREAQALLLIEQEADSNFRQLVLDEWHRAFREGNALDEVWEGSTPEKQEEFRSFRSALPLAVKDFLAQHRQVKIGTDTAVPQGRFQELMLFHRKKVNEGNFQSVTFGHIGESHVHLNILPRNEEEARKARTLYPELVKKAIALGGTFSAEHGVGKLKRRYLIELLGDQAVDEMVQIKRVFDPHLILGQGNLFEIQ